MNNAAENSAWRSTLALLASLSSPRTDVGDAMVDSGPGVRSVVEKVDRKCARQKATASRTVKVVERISNRSILVCWCDATVGRYGEQVWIRCVARRSSNCVLSGLPVRRGDMVYRPSQRFQRPVNCEEVILALMLDGLDADSE